MNSNWVNTYQITQNTDVNSISTTLMKLGQPIEEDEEVLFSFQAENYTRAAEIYNRFLGFEPYVLMPENSIEKRIYSLIGADNKEIKPVVLTLYKPLNIAEGE